MVSIAALALIGFVATWSLRTTTDAPAAAADAFLGALVDERFDDAFAMLCASDRSGHSVDEFRHAVSPFAAGLEGHDAYTLDPSGDRRTVHFTVDYGNRTDQFDLDVVRHNDGTWQVCSFLD